MTVRRHRLLISLIAFVWDKRGANYDIWQSAPWRDRPKLLLQMEIRYDPVISAGRP